MKVRWYALMPVLATIAWGQQSPLPQPAPPPQVVEIAGVVSTPRVVATVPFGETAVVKYRVLLSNGQSVDDLRGLPVQPGTYDLEGVNVTTQTTKCRMETGECFITAEKPGPLTISLYTGSFGRGSVTINFVVLRASVPATISITASQVQAKEGSVVTLTATSPISSPGPVQVWAETTFSSQSERAEKYVYLPNGVSYGQRIDINTENVRPLDGRDRRFFQVQMTGPNGYVIAQGFGSSVGATELRQFDATVDDNNDLSFSISAPFNPSVEYTVVLLRDDRFRLEISQLRGELFVYPQGERTVLVFNKGTFGGGPVLLPAGHYTVVVHAHDRSNGINWSHSRADALGLNAGYVLR